MRKTMMAMAIVALGAGATGCATKGYVNKNVGQVNDKVTALSQDLEKTQERTRGNEQRIGEVDHEGAVVAGKHHQQSARACEILQGNHGGYLPVASCPATLRSGEVPANLHEEREGSIPSKEEAHPANDVPGCRRRVAVVDGVAAPISGFDALTPLAPVLEQCQQIILFVLHHR